MTDQRDLWDFAGDAGRDERDRTRRHTIKRLRASGHWLTLLRVARTIPQPFTLNDRREC